MKKSFRTILSTEKGFTLAELIVVLALLSILAAGGAGALSAYSKHAAFRKNNEQARIVYQAAQAAVTHAKASGMLEELNRSIAAASQEAGAVPRGIAAEITSAAGSADAAGKGTAVKSAAAAGNSTAVKNAAAAGSSTAVKNAAAAGSGAAGGSEAAAQLQYIWKKRDDADGLLSELLAPYLAPDVLRGASVCIEADFRKGIVYAVCYSSSAECFSYDGSAGVSLADRTTGAREKIGLGCYGGQEEEA